MFASAKGKKQKQVRRLQCQEPCIEHIPHYLSGLWRAHVFRQPFSKQLYMTLHLGDRRSTASLRYRNRAEITLFISEQKLYPVLFLCQRRRQPLQCEKSLKWRVTCRIGFHTVYQIAFRVERKPIRYRRDLEIRGQRLQRKRR